MRVLFAVIVLLGGGWSGYWFVGSTAKREVLVAWFSAQEQQGWVAEYADMTVQGFPNRFDTTFKDLELADPSTELAWSAPFFQILALSYKPNHIIAVWPPQQTLASPREKIDIANSDMRASVVFEADTALAIDRTTVTIADLVVVGSTGWETRMQSAVFATRRSETLVLGHDIGFTAEQVTPAQEFRRRIDPAGVLPEMIEIVHLDMLAGFDAPWDRFALEKGRPNPTHLTINAMKAVWGTLDFRATGAVDIDAEGYPTGEIAVKATNWRDMLDLAVTSGALHADAAMALEKTLGFIATLSGNSKSLDVTLGFADRLVSIGPIPIGSAPRIVLR